MRIIFSVLVLLCSLSAYAQSVSSDAFLERPFFHDDRPISREEQYRRERFREEERLRRERAHEHRREHRREEWRERHHHHDDEREYRR